MTYVFTFGKFRGKTLDDIDLKELDSYLGWLEGIKNPSSEIKEALDEIGKYLERPDIKRELERELGDDQ